MLLYEPGGFFKVSPWLYHDELRMVVMMKQFVGLRGNCTFIPTIVLVYSMVIYGSQRFAIQYPMHFPSQRLGRI